MKKSRDIVIGLIIIALGVVFGLKTFGIADIDIFFDGWWTLIIIIPSIVNIFKSENKIGSAVTLSIGILLLLMERGFFDFSTLLKVAIPIVIIAIGVKIIYKGIKKQNQPDLIFNTTASRNTFNPNTERKNHTVIFGGDEIEYSNQVFEGGSFTAVFGGIDCDLRNSVINHDVIINATAIFGGIDILLPVNVNVKVSSNSIFGGVDSKEHLNSHDNTVTVFVNGSGIFGGVDVK